MQRLACLDADTRAVLKRCILVEVTAQCVKDSVRKKRKFGSEAISMAESLGLVQRPVICDMEACLLGAQTRQKPDTDRCKSPALALHLPGS